MRRTSCLLALREIGPKYDLTKGGIAAGSTSWPSTSIKEIAILGGGITGLASAYFATRLYPDARINLFESSNRFGGWIKSSKHTHQGGTVVFEHGPRSLRPAYGTLGLIFNLGLKDQLLLTPKTSPAARNRFIYLENRLINVPRSFLGAVQEPVMRRALLEVLQTFFRVDRPPEQGETIGQFFRRRGLKNTADDLVSAMLHGIYAGDIDDLSVQSIFPNLVLLEKVYGSPWNYFKQRLLHRLSRSSSSLHSAEEYNEMKLAWGFIGNVELDQDAEFLAANSASIYTLRGGLETLIFTLVDYLKNHPRVKLTTNAMIQSIQPGEKNPGKSAQDVNEKVRLVVRCDRQETSKDSQTKFIDSEYDGIISAIPSAGLAKLCPPLNTMLNKTPAATVCVVNLFYDQTDLLPAQGFGYLIPKSMPKSLNPEGTLGVVFDSDATPGLDTVPGTKLTVMLGGPNWKTLSKDLLPSNSEAIEMAKGVLAAQLGITQEPVLAQANLQVDCIPQYTVHHKDRMWQAREAILNNGHWSRIRVAGSWYNGVAINSCIESAFRATRELTLGLDLGFLKRY